MAKLIRLATLGWPSYKHCHQMFWADGKPLNVHSNVVRRFTDGEVFTAEVAQHGNIDNFIVRKVIRDGYELRMFPQEIISIWLR